MRELTPLDWLCLQRLFFKRPKKGLEFLRQREAAPCNNFSAEIVTAAQKDLETIQRLGIDLICWSEDRYPSLLKEMVDPPLVLLAKGEWPAWDDRPWVAIVGARKASAFGLIKTREIVRDLVENGIGVVSGLAYGIDAAAHQACVEAQGVTWGVLGSGIDILYPKRNIPLAKKMCQQGGYLSEFPIGAWPSPFYFPQRNRIISGLSQATIVVEATLKSGSLITAKYGLEQGREVFAVPPPKEDIAYEGTKWLLEEGAMPYESGEQILEEIKMLRNCFPVLKPLSKEAGRKPGKNSFKEEKITSPLLSLLTQPHTLDYLIGKLHKPSHIILSELIQLETDARIEKRPGGLWQSRS